MRYIISRKVNLEVAHRLDWHEGKCHQTHGHRIVVEAAVSSTTLDRNGIVIDFSELKDFMEVIKSELDHSFLNDIIKNPTAENIGLYIYGQFLPWCNSKQLDPEYIKVWETENSCMELSGI